MRIDIMTLFPALVETVLGESIIGRAQKSGALEIHTHNIRDYAENKHNRVDDTPYGGGWGMLMAAPPIYRCYKALAGDDAPPVVYLSPRGKVLNQRTAQRLAALPRLVLLCGHYEGVDERALTLLQAEEISIGDYVLTGGELACCILVDAVGRLCDGVLSDAECHEKESFGSGAAGLLEYPQYTRPYDFMGLTVPDVLLSGHHENIDRWRREQSLRLTKERRPDLFLKKEKPELTETESPPETEKTEDGEPIHRRLPNGE